MALDESWVSFLGAFTSREKVQPDEDLQVIWAGPETARHMVALLHYLQQRTDDPKSLQMVSATPERRAEIRRSIDAMLEWFEDNEVPGNMQVYLMADLHRGVVVPVAETARGIMEERYQSVKRLSEEEGYDWDSAFYEVMEPNIDWKPPFDSDVARKMFTPELYQYYNRRGVYQQAVGNIDGAADEKLRAARVLEQGLDTVDTRGAGLTELLQPRVADATIKAVDVAGASIFWVTEELRGVVEQVAMSIPGDFICEQHLMGIVPRNALVVFAGEWFYPTVWLLRTLRHPKLNRDVIEHVAWFPGTTLSDGISSASGFDHTMVEMGPMWRMVWGFLLTANQKLVHTYRERPSRGAVRRFVRASYGVPDVTVVTLRRHREQPEMVGSSRNYTHRWLVNAHWRNQWYPSLNLHKPKLIEAYVKGPEDMPLMVKSRLFRVSR